MGTKEWFDLIYWDEPKYDYAAMKVKIEKQEAKGMGRRVGPGPGGQEAQASVLGGLIIPQAPQLLLRGEEEVEEEEVQMVQEVQEVQEVQGILGLEDQNYVVVDPGVAPLESFLL